MFKLPLRIIRIKPPVLSYGRLGPRSLNSVCFYSSLNMRIPGPQRYRSPRRVSSENYPPQYDAEYTVSNSGGIIGPSDAVVNLLSYPTLVIERQLEMMNVFLGFEQANRYTIMDPNNGSVLGYMEEEDFGITKAILRQIYRLHRPFSVKVFDRHGTHILTIRRPFSFINSHIKALLPSSDIVVGETRQQWHLWRRKYNLFLPENSEKEAYVQFGVVDAPFLSFSFPVMNEYGHVIGAIDRNWVGLGRELFTDTGVYILRMDPSSFTGLEHSYPNIAGPLTLDQKAVMLGTAVSIDFDYFSRHSNRGGMFGFYDYE